MSRSTTPTPKCHIDVKRASFSMDVTPKHDESYLSTIPKLYRTQALDIARLDLKQYIS